jgi:plastocyanin
VFISSLVDADGDGTYHGTATFPALLTAASANATRATGVLGLIVGSSAGENSYSVEIGTAVDGVISSRATGRPVTNASVSALLAQQASDGSMFYMAAGDQSGEPNPQVTGVDGRYSYGAGSGIYRIDVAAAGYQPYRSGDIDAGETPLAQNIALAPAIAEAAAKTIYVTANGYMPAAADVAPGSVVEFVNLDLADHSSTGSSWDSGMLATGQSFKVKFAGAGSFSFGDAANPLLQGAITVAPGAGIDEHIYLPMVRR